MLPIVDEEIYSRIINEVTSDVSTWRKKMIHYIKDENPEINSAIVELAQKTDLDPKAVATGMYVAYVLLEEAAKEEGAAFSLEE